MWGIPGTVGRDIQKTLQDQLEAQLIRQQVEQRIKESQAEQVFRQQELELRRKEAEERAAERTADRARLERQETRQTASDVLAGATPGPQTEAVAKLIRAYPGTAPRITERTTLPATSLGLGVSDTSGPQTFPVLEPTPEQAKEAGRSAGEAQLQRILGGVLPPGATDRRQAIRQHLAAAGGTTQGALDALKPTPEEEATLTAQQRRIADEDRRAFAQFQEGLIRGRPREPSPPVIVQTDQGIFQVDRTTNIATPVRTATGDVVQPRPRAPVTTWTNDGMVVIDRETRQATQVTDASGAQIQPRPYAPMPVWTAEGLAQLDRATGQTTPVTPAGGGPQVQPQATAASRQRTEQQQAVGRLLDSVSELSGRINVNQGVYARAAGEIAKQQAKLNLDDDVAEYESLVSAFTPIWARALGHAGVLTQQDVDSARAALPKATDSKTLKDRKIARIHKVMGSEGGGETGAGTTTPAPGGISYQDYLNRRK